MPQPIILTDTAATFSQSLVFDSRGIGSLGLYTEVSEGPDSVQVYVFTRKAGKPWMFVPTFEISLGQIVPSVATLWPFAGYVTEWIDGYLGLLDESLVVVQPNGNTPVAASGDTLDSSITFSTSPSLLRGDFGNSLSFTMVDPGVPDSPISLSSPDGYEFVISLETDSMGAITTQASGIASLIHGSGVPGNDPQGWIVDATANDSGQVQAPQTVVLTGGDSDATATTYEVTGSY